MNVFTYTSIPEVEIDNECIKENQVYAIDQTATNTLLLAKIQSNLDTLINHYFDCAALLIKFIQWCRTKTGSMKISAEDLDKAAQKLIQYTYRTSHS